MLGPTRIRPSAFKNVPSTYTSARYHCARPSTSAPLLTTASPSTYHRGPLYVPDVQTQQDIILSLINHGADPLVGQLVPGIEGEVSILAEASSPKTRNLLANIQLARRTGLAFGALRGLAQRPRTATLVTSYVKALRGL